MAILLNLVKSWGVFSLFVTTDADLLSFCYIIYISSCACIELLTHSSAHFKSDESKPKHAMYNDVITS